MRRSPTWLCPRQPLVLVDCGPGSGDRRAALQAMLVSQVFVTVTEHLRRTT